MQWLTGINFVLEHKWSESVNMVLLPKFAVEFSQSISETLQAALFDTHTLLGYSKTVSNLLILDWIHPFYLQGSLQTPVVKCL